MWGQQDYMVSRRCKSHTTSVLSLYTSNERLIIVGGLIEQLASHLKIVHPEESASYALDCLRTTLKTRSTPQDLFQREVNRTRPAHYVLFTIEPLFLLAGLSVSSGHAPEDRISEWFRALIEYVRGIPLGEIEGKREGGGRVDVKLRWFEKMLARWEDKEYIQDLDGSLWELGWRDFDTLSWGLL